MGSAIGLVWVEHGGPLREPSRERRTLAACVAEMLVHGNRLAALFSDQVEGGRKLQGVFIEPLVKLKKELSSLAHQSGGVFTAKDAAQVTLEVCSAFRIGRPISSGVSPSTSPSTVKA